ncbi:dihydroneopterin aldolase [Arsenophonus symbiont of Ornithomya chloropus]|uniref:dihydroneopterin aldolase n=1 Tax=Arsenophonus symbiont of Ornithomya chloropus TaxID=634121 RepID=UPI0032B2FA08
MDIIFIKKLTVFTTIGVYDWEQTIKQKLLIDIKIGYDHQYIDKGDDIKYCLDYSEISQIVIEHIEKRKFKLIERVAEDIADILLNKFDIYWVRIKVVKLNAIPKSKQVGIIIQRKKK